ncbi:MAG: hypothetical protein VYE53_12055, partial [Planctomycetota bacterium]|nr:hypothetical protein [Planctomycetota bacterium]
SKVDTYGLGMPTYGATRSIKTWNGWFPLGFRTALRLNQFTIQSEETKLPVTAVPPNMHARGLYRRSEQGRDAG